MSLKVFDTPDGSRGIDCNSVLDEAKCRAFRATGARLVTRYVRREPHHDYDLTSGEAITILRAGLGLNIVQHVDVAWVPNTELGKRYGATAVAECRAIGVPAGVTVALDLEDVRVGVPVQDVINYCKAWYTQVRAAGFQPILYVGWRCGLTGADLYYKLPFVRYWSAYNLNADNFPAVRGVCARQGTERVLLGVRYDTDVYRVDKKGGRATCFALEGWPTE